MIIPDKIRRQHSNVAALTSVVGFFLLAAILFALYWWPEAKAMLRLERHYHDAAVAWISGGDWFDTQLLRPPLQTLFLGALYALFGTHIWIAQLAQLILLISTGLLLRGTLTGLAVDSRIATWSAIVLVVNPLTIAFATYLTPEILHLFLLMLLLRLLVAAQAAINIEASPIESISRSGLLASFAAGAVLGLCLLASDLLSYFWPVLLISVAWSGSWMGRLFRAGLFLLALILVTAPALNRGWEIADRPIITDTSALTIWLGLADTMRSDLVRDMSGPRTASYINSSEDHAGRLAYASQQIDEIVNERGLLGSVWGQLNKQYFRLLNSRTWPAAQLQGPECRGYIAAYRSLSPQLNRAIDYVFQGWHIIVLVLFALGLVAWKHWRQPWLLLVAAFVVYYVVYYGLHQAKTQALVPLLPVLSLFAGNLIARIPDFRTTRSPLSLPRRLFGVALAVLLVALALLGPVLDSACG